MSCCNSKRPSWSCRRHYFKTRYGRDQYILKIVTHLAHALAVLLLNYLHGSCTIEPLMSSWFHQYHATSGTSNKYINSI